MVQRRKEKNQAFERFCLELTSSNAECERFRRRRRVIRVERKSQRTESEKRYLLIEVGAVASACMLEAASPHLLVRKLRKKNQKQIRLTLLTHLPKLSCLAPAARG